MFWQLAIVIIKKPQTTFLITEYMVLKRKKRCNKLRCKLFVNLGNNLFT